MKIPFCSLLFALGVAAAACGGVEDDEVATTEDAAHATRANLTSRIDVLNCIDDYVTYTVSNSGTLWTGGFWVALYAGSSLRASHYVNNLYGPYSVTFTDSLGLYPSGGTVHVVADTTNAVRETREWDNNADSACGSY